jgi:3-methyladenine DNA glycosylase/8-oxoguanine DNA glycosylase
MGEGTVVRLTAPAPFDFGWAVRFLAARTIPSLESVGAGGYTRVARLGGAGVATLGVRATTGARGEVRLTARADLAVPAAALRAAVIRLFDLDADLGAFLAGARRDRVLGPLVRRHAAGIRLPQLLDPFEGVARAILGQQVSVAAATTLADRLVRLLGTPATPAPGTRPDAPVLRAFPLPGEVAAAGGERLRALGLTRAKAAALAGAARAVADGALDLGALPGLPAAEAQAALLALPGVGPWTASYIRMRALGDRDAFPAADLGVIKALARRGVPRRRIETVAERWRPWRAYATLHLWESLGAPDE